jgi:lipopolysaccharide/colanic/teichoic acid biosynthesis glycosyltransferase
MSTIPKMPVPPPPPEAREPWPEIDRLRADAEMDLVLCPTWYAVGKVVLDYTVALTLLPIAFPVILLAALAVKLTSSGPAFYLQTRVGLGGRLFRIVKLRTMHRNCERHSGIKWAGKHDDRVTPLGKLLRRTHIDELPQLFNVLLGQMSLVGPRPERPEVIKAKGLEELVPGYPHRLLVKPGVTGLAQVQLAADTDITSVRYKVVYDLYYVQQQGVLLDLRLVLATVAKVLGMKPTLIRRLFLLPTRQRLAQSFQGNLTAEHEPLTHLQPA